MSCIECRAVAFHKMDCSQRNQPLPVSEPMLWRVGTRVPEHIYDGDGRPLVTMPSAELAALVVAAVNALSIPPKPAEVAPTDYVVPVGPLEAECVRLAARLAVVERQLADKESRLEEVQHCCDKAVANRARLDQLEERLAAGCPCGCQFGQQVLEAIPPG